ncbi:MAG: TIGR02391 family protein [Bacilli bacterium]|nr:TIGR02391 family protein [Bacilli bacterium]
MNLPIQNKGVDLKNIASVVAEFLTHSKIDDFLFKCNIENKGTPTKVSPNEYTYIPGSNKVDKLYNSFAYEINKSQSTNKLTVFLEAICNPISYVNIDRDKYSDFILKLNKVLVMMGAKINDEGKLVPVERAKTLDEVDRRVNNLKGEFERRRFHPEIMKYCKREYLSEDYFHALQEAVKGILQRIRDLTGYNDDGNKLIEKSFNNNTPKLVFNSLANDNEKNEYIGLRRIIEGLVNMIRNVTAHKPRIFHNEDLGSTLEVFSIISYVHKYLDICQVASIY